MEDDGKCIDWQKKQIVVIKNGYIDLIAITAISFLSDLQNAW